MFEACRPSAQTRKPCLNLLKQAWGPRCHPTKRQSKGGNFSSTFLYIFPYLKPYANHLKKAILSEMKLVSFRWIFQRWISSSPTSHWMLAGSVVSRSGASVFVLFTVAGIEGVSLFLSSGNPVMRDKWVGLEVSLMDEREFWPLKWGTIERWGVSQIETGFRW